jgi:hypothetical protein
MLNYFDGKENLSTMTTLYKTTVPQKDRAKIFTWNPEQVLKVPLTQLNVDAVILPMGGESKYDGSHYNFYNEPTFPGRYELVKAAKLPVIGRFDLNAGMFLREQHTAGEVQGHTFRTNYILEKFINSWHVGNWTWDNIIAKKGVWRDISMVMISMVETVGFKGAQISDFWQALDFTHFVNHLKFIMDSGFVPNIPICLYTGPWWLGLYQNNMIVEIENRKSWLWMALGEWTLQSTATFNTLDEIFAFRPLDGFKFSGYPDNYFERILMHNFTGEKQKVKYVTDVLGNPLTVDLSLWQDTREEMYKFLKFSGSPVVIIPPPEPPIEPPIPPIPPTDIDAKLTALELRVSHIEAFLRSFS